MHVLQGKLRPQERAEWEAFEEQRLNPTPPTHVTWRKQMQHLVQMEQQQQYYAQEDAYAGYEESDYGYDERSYGSQQQQGVYRQEQYYGVYDEGVPDAVPDQEAAAEAQLAYGQGMPDSPGGGSRAAIAAAAAAAAAVAAAGAPRPSSRSWRMNRPCLPATDAATDSQEDEAAAYSCQDPAAGAAEGAGGGAGSPAGPSLLHLLAVGEAISKTEGVASQDRRAAYTEVCGCGLLAGFSDTSLPTLFLLHVVCAAGLVCLH